MSETIDLVLNPRGIEQARDALVEQQDHLLGLLSDLTGRTQEAHRAWEVSQAALEAMRKQHAALEHAINLLDSLTMGGRS